MSEVFSKRTLLKFSPRALLLQSQVGSGRRKVRIFFTRFECSLGMLLMMLGGAEKNLDSGTHIRGMISLVLSVVISLVLSVDFSLVLSVVVFARFECGFFARFECSYFARFECSFRRLQRSSSRRSQLWEKSAFTFRYEPCSLGYFYHW